MTDELDDLTATIGATQPLDASQLRAAEAHIRRRARDPEDADLLVDMLLGPLTTQPGGRRRNIRQE